MHPERPASRSLSVAFCGAAVGCGHGRAALAVRDAMRVRGQLGQANFVDALENADPWFALMYRDGYLRAVRHAPAAVGAIYDRTDTPRHGPRRIGSLLDRLQDGVLRRFRAHPAITEADLVVSTHFLTSAVLGRMRLSGALRAPLVTVVTDEHPHAVWLHRGSDVTCVASTEARSTAIAGGLDPSRVAVTGIPVDPRFGLIAPMAAWRAEPLAHRPAILVSGGGFGIGDVESTVTELLAALRDCDVTVVCGRNEPLERQLVAMAARSPGSDRGNALTVVGYTKVMHELMSAADILVGKPGGLTTTEARALGLPMVLLRPIPGQEERNARALVAAGAAVRAESAQAAASHVAALVADRARLAEMRRASAGMGKPRAAFEVAARAGEALLRRPAACADLLLGMSAA
jgi:processive 1,2-diacylglycerol beta-glucosyltransferase